MTTQPRLRSVEGIGPRKSELIADRLSAASAFAKLTALQVDVEGAAIDTVSLAALAVVQRAAEDELLARWQHFRDFYLRYLEATRQREIMLRRALDAFAKATGESDADPKVRGALRICRLRRPPVAKVRALIAEASAVAT